MKASVVDLRYRMKEVLGALRRNETVDILYHGKVTGTIYPVMKERKKRDIRNHPFFGMYDKHAKSKSVEKIMDELRGERYRAL